MLWTVRSQCVRGASYWWQRPSKAVLAESQKLHGNSSYGKCLTNKEKHYEVHNCNRSEVPKLINSRVFHRLNAITNALYKVECLKSLSKKTFTPNFLFCLRLRQAPDAGILLWLPAAFHRQTRFPVRPIRHGQSLHGFQLRNTRSLCETTHASRILWKPASLTTTRRL